jgi:hypothetical protein
MPSVQAEEYKPIDSYELADLGITWRDVLMRTVGGAMRGAAQAISPIPQPIPGATPRLIERTPGQPPPPQGYVPPVSYYQQPVSYYQQPSIPEQLGTKTVSSSRVMIAVEPGTPKLVLQYPARVTVSDKKGGYTHGRTAARQKKPGKGLFGSHQDLMPIVMLGAGIVIGKYVLK